MKDNTMSEYDTSEQAFVTLAEKINDAELKLAELEEALLVVGHPADAKLQERLDALRIEEEALKRNYTDLLEHPHDEQERLKKVITLLEHIEREEASVQHEADFLAQSAPSSVILAATAASRVFDALGAAFNKYLKGKRPMGESVFVNHTHDDLVKFYGIKDEEEKET